MRTEYTILRPGDQPGERHEIDLPPDPGFARLRQVIEPLLDGGLMEHVTVLYDGRRHDMFVDEIGSTNWKPGYPLPLNELASAIYRANWLAQNPKDNPSDLPGVHGPAVLFHRIVWS